MTVFERTSEGAEGDLQEVVKEEPELKAMVTLSDRRERGTTGRRTTGDVINGGSMGKRDASSACNVVSVGELGTRREDGRTRLG